ncbi:hypothetical protein SAVIM40S_01391 [Streptomyces avidinii]
MKRPGKRLPPARSLLGTALALVALLASAPPAAASLSPSPSGGSPRPVVTVAQGALRGQSRDGAQEFLGVPYAAPPVGTPGCGRPRPRPGGPGCGRPPGRLPRACSSLPWA